MARGPSTYLQAVRGAALSLGISPEEYAAHREAGEMWCSGCRNWHPAGDFVSRGYCGPAYNALQRQKRVERNGGDFPKHILAKAGRIGIPPAEYDARWNAGERWCSICHDWHPKGEFVLNSARVDGVADHCRSGHRRRDAKRAIARRQAVTVELASDSIRQKAIDAMCRSCEPDGVCHMSDCPLRPVSPLPLASGRLRRLSA